MHSDESIWVKPNNGPTTAIDISKPIKPEEYLVIKSYQATTKKEISVKKQCKVFVIEKNLTGWWFIDSQEGQGRINTIFTEPINLRSSFKEVLKFSQKDMCHSVF